MAEDDGTTSGRSSPPTPKKIKMESEETKELLKVEDHSEDESEEIEDDDEEEGGDGDGSPQSPPLLDMIDLPLSSPLPPTPPLPSSPRDLNMDQQDSEDEGPPPGWDNPYQLKEQVELILIPAALSAISSEISDIKMEDVQQDAWNGDCAAPELVASDKKGEEQESEDEGPPPGWDSKCQPEPELQVACPTITQSDIKTEDVQQDAWNGVTVTNHIPSDIKMEEQESEDEGPPPGWDSKCQPEPELQMPCPTITQSDMKVEEQEAEDEGPPPGWDSKLESTITESDIKTDDIQQDAPNTDDHIPTPQVLPSDIKVEEHESEDEGPPPGWDSKFQPQPELQTPNPTTPPSESKIEDNEGPPPGWKQQSQDHHPSGAKLECEEQKNIEAAIERPPKQQSPSPIKPQIPVQKPPLTTNNPEMGQMVCGSCRRLLSYPKGARFVECGCCLEENYLLQEHEVGQVICGGCDVLLMYPYGAPKVRCVNCSTETEIGDQNRRPPLSDQQRWGRRHLKRVQTGKC